VEVISKRVGLVVPSLNVVVEDDLRRELPVDVGFHIARLRLRKTDGRVTQQALLDAGREAAAHATLLADAGMDAIALNCTGASISDGPAGAQRLCEEMAAATQTPSTTTILSVVRALQTRGMKRIVHVCPFTAEFSTDEARYLRAAGFEVVESCGLNFTDARLAARLLPAEIVTIAAQMDCAAADGLFLSCANIRAIEAVPLLQQRLGKPVVTSNQAVIWELLAMIGHADAMRVLQQAA
jgi:maleate isomerase